MDDYKEEDTTLLPNQINTIDLFLAFHAMLEKKKIASLLKQLLPVTMFPSKKKSPLFQSVCVKYRKGRQCRLILSSILIPNKKLWQRLWLFRINENGRDLCWTRK